MVLKKKNHLPFTTYQAGLLQTRANRKLNMFFTDALKAYDLSMPEWALLGLVCDHKKIRMRALAAYLEVEPPFATKLSRSLEHKALISRKMDVNDSRVRWIALTPKGTDLINQVEVNLKEHMKSLLKPLNIRELVVYVRVLTKISEL